MNRSIARLKEEARNHEQQEAWIDAIRAYQQALKIAEEGEGEIELGLYNRIGDLFLREGKQRDAVEYYELAADRYEAAGLLNSAIALCNKVLRHDPERSEPYYKLGRLTLAQGFLSEARRWSVEYAERMMRAGKREEAFAALNEFASHAADPEARELLAQYLLAHDETAEALEQLLEAYRARSQGGADQADQIESLREKILALDPEMDLEQFVAASTSEDLVLMDQVEDDSDHGASVGALPSLGIETAADSAGIESLGSGVIQTERMDLDLTIVVTPPAELAAEPGAPSSGELVAETGGESDHGVVITEWEFPDVESAPIDLPELDAGYDEGAGFETPDLDLADDDAPPPLPLLGDVEDGPGVAAGASQVELVEESPPDLPPEPADYIDLASLLLEHDPTEVGLTRYVVETPESTGDEDQDFMQLLAQFKSKVSEHLGDEDMESRYDLGLAFKEMGLLDEAISQFQIALRGLDDQLKIYEELGDCFMQKGEYTIALKILKGALRLPQTGAGELIGVHYQLGRSHEELGHTAEARDAYERVIALDLEFRDTSARLARL